MFLVVFFDKVEKYKFPRPPTPSLTPMGLRKRSLEWEIAQHMI